MSESTEAQPTDAEIMETRQLILDTAEKIFSDSCDKQLLDDAEQGSFPQGLWRVIVENGFNTLGAASSGTSPADLYAFLQHCGRFAVPIPIAETLISNLWLEGGDRISSVGIVVEDRIEDLIWANEARRCIGVDPQSYTIVVADAAALQPQGTNLAGEPLFSVPLTEVEETLELPTSPYALMALGRINLMAGCLQTVLSLGLQFAAERVQFGRSISKFQAIQHSLAVVAAEVAASKRAADAAVDALDSDRFVCEVAASKARIGEAAGVVAEQVHQIHGAMGFTHEHRLHHYTRRAWAWRDSFGNEFYWQQYLGAHIAKLGADASWAFIATRG